jgi:hypothetical protein
VPTGRRAWLEGSAKAVPDTLIAAFRNVVARGVQRCSAGLGAAIEPFRAMDMQTVLARAEAELSAI